MGKTMTIATDCSASAFSTPGRVWYSRRRVCWAGMLAACFALGLFAGAASAQSGDRATAPSTKLVITGSSTLEPLIADLGRRFERIAPEARIIVEAGGSGRGISDAISGKADIGMVSRALKADEKKQLFAITVARDGVAMVVHRNNPVRAITRDQLEGVLLGRISNWKELGGQAAPIHLITRTAGRGVLDLVSEYAHVKPEQFKATRATGDNAEALAALLADPNGMLILSFGFTLDSIQRGKPIRALTLDGVPATSAELRAGTYPISRPLNLVTRDVPEGLARQFIEYVQTPASRPVIEQFDFIPYLQ